MWLLRRPAGLSIWSLWPRLKTFADLFQHIYDCVVFQKCPSAFFFRDPDPADDDLVPNAFIYSYTHVLLDRNSCPVFSVWFLNIYMALLCGCLELQEPLNDLW